MYLVKSTWYTSAKMEWKKLICYQLTDKNLMPSVKKNSSLYFHWQPEGSFTYIVMDIKVQRYNVTYIHHTVGQKHCKSMKSYPDSRFLFVRICWAEMFLWCHLCVTNLFPPVPLNGSPKAMPCIIMSVW